jgi:demethylmenaquinone methyltransferase/2-methoxy-6-polyprenyl-1,4-benzoquinol methylase
MSTDPAVPSIIIRQSAEKVKGRLPFENPFIFRIFMDTLTADSSVQKQYVRSLFDSIAFRYDLLNHLLSGGIDLYWRRRAVEHLKEIAPRRILDVATGTADFALATMRLAPRQVVGVDISEKMLSLGREKIAARGLDTVITLATGEAEKLAFEDGSFDAAIVAFGARNFENLEKGLAEMRRVLRPGGKIVVLEFSRPAVFPFKQLYMYYFRRILPFVGRMLSKNSEAYSYLPDTVMRFPEGDAFLAILGKTGFSSPAAERLTFGIASIYTGVR